MTEILGGIEDVGSLRGDINQVWEEAVARAQEESRKAGQIAQQIKKDKAINNQFSLFLAMLLKKIPDDTLIAEIYNTFFKTINPKNNVTYLRKDTNTKVLIWFFIPFFLSEAQQYHILPFYTKLNPETASQSLKNYVRYLENLSSTYHDNIPLNQTAFVNLVILIAQHYLKPEGIEDMRNQVLVELYSEE